MVMRHKLELSWLATVRSPAWQLFFQYCDAKTTRRPKDVYAKETKQNVTFPRITFMLKSENIKVCFPRHDLFYDDVMISAAPDSYRRSRMMKIGIKNQEPEIFRSK